MQNRTNKLLEIFNSNRKLFLLLGAITPIFLIIIVTIITMNNTLQPEEITTNTTKTPTQPAPTKFVTVNPQPTKTLPTVTRTKVINDTAVQLQQAVGNTQYTVSPVKSYGSDWVVFDIVNPQTDPARVIVKLENGTWTVKLGPGTLFDAEDLQALGAPENLVQEANDPIN